MLKKVNYESATDSYWVNLSVPEMEFLAALMFKVRLGNKHNKYIDAAMTISNGIEDEVGCDWMANASTDVGVFFSLDDDSRKMAAIIESDYACIDVRGGDAPPPPAIPAP
jgi:hypothetical protein